MRNTVNGTTGPVVQAGSITGDIHLTAWPDRVIPRQLPAPAGHFTGRTEQLATLDGLLDAGAGALVISAFMRGTGGIGKTALALHWAHRIADRFPDGQLYVDMRGFGPTESPMPANEAVRDFLDAFGVVPEFIPVSPDARVALLRSTLAGKRVLLVLDNVRDADQVRPLLPGTPTCLTVITSRNSLDGLLVHGNVTPVELDRLPDAEARTLLVARLGTARVEAEPEIVDALVTRCAGLPLALGILAARAAAQPSTPLAAFADELADRLDALDTGDLGLREIFSWSVKALTDDAARLFRLLGLHPGPDFDLHAAANLLGVDDRSCRKLLTELVNAHLVERYQPTRYRLHDLLRDYAAELAAREPGRSEALGRMFDFYLHTAWAADRAIVEHRLPVAIADAAKGVRPLSFADRPLAITWCQIEHPVLSGMVQRALDTGFDSHSWRLAMALRSYFDTAGHWHDYASVYRVAKIAVDRAANPAEQVRVHRGLGRGLSRLNLWDPAESALGDSLRYAIQSRDSIQRSHTHEAFSWLYSMAGMHDQALDHAIRGLALYVEGEHSRWRAFALNIAGRCHAALGQLDQALALSSEALALHLELDDRTGEAEALDNVGHVLHRLGSTAEALDHCQRALDLYIKLRNIPGQADTLEHLGDIHAAKGDFATAKAEWTEAVAILDRLSHPRADAVRTKIEAPPPAHPSSV